MYSERYGNTRYAARADELAAEASMLAYENRDLSPHATTSGLHMYKDYTTEYGVRLCTPNGTFRPFPLPEQTATISEFLHNQRNTKGSRNSVQRPAWQPVADDGEVEYPPQKLVAPSSARQRRQQPLPRRQRPLTNRERVDKGELPEWLQKMPSDQGRDLMSISLSDCPHVHRKEKAADVNQKVGFKLWYTNNDLTRTDHATVEADEVRKKRRPIDPNSIQFKRLHKKRTGFMDEITRKGRRTINANTFTSNIHFDDHNPQNTVISNPMKHALGSKKRVHKEKRRAVNVINWSRTTVAPGGDTASEHNPSFLIKEYGDGVYGDAEHAYVHPRRTS